MSSGGREKELKERQLRNASFNGDITKVKELLNSGVNIDSQDSKDRDRKTALTCAAESGNVEIVRFLLQKGATPYYTDKFGFRPLDYAMVADNTEACDELKERGERVNYESVLRLSARLGKLDKVQDSLKHVDNINSTDGGMAALHHAAEMGHTDIVQVLLMNGAQYDSEDKYGFTPVVYSYCNDHSSATELLMAAGGTLDYEQLLLWGAMEGKKGKVMEALEKGVNIDCTANYLQKTALHWTSQNGHKDIVTLLLLSAANVDCKSDYESTPLHYASQSGHTEIVKALISKGADVHSKNRYGRTPLHYASENGHTETAELLISKSADVHGRDAYQKTPLHDASHHGYEDIVEVLVSATADVNSKDENGNASLHYACEEGQVSTVATLLSYPNIDPAPKNDDDQTPMELVPPDHPKRTVILQLFERFEQCRTAIPVESYSKVFLCGDSTAGKSSLSQVLKYRSDKPLDYQYDPEELVTGVVPLTAGIEPHTIVSREVGHIILYDFAGHREYYSSHAAVVENIMLRSPGVFNILTKLTEDKSVFEKNLHFWLNFIANVSAKLHKQAQVIVVGSRFDLFTTDGTSFRKLVDGIVARSALKNQIYRGFVAVDCHRPGGKGVRELTELLSQCCKDVIDRSDSISYYCHVQCSFLHDLQEVAIMVFDLCDKLKAHNHPSLPSEQAQVLEHLTVLSDKGLIVFLPNEDPSKRWIVIKKEVLLTKVIGVLFAPEEIDRVHLEISSNTGIISVAALREAFPQFDPEMLTGFLTCLQFCQKIDAKFLNSIDTNVTPHDQMKIDCSQLLFFPSLIAVECPAEITIKASFGWCLYCSDPNRFLSTRFLHVLLLLLAHKYSLLKKAKAGEIRKAIPQDMQQHERRCTVWKNGIYWKRDNTEVLVEVSDYNRCVTVLISDKNANKMLSSVIQKIRYLRDTLCPCNSIEYVIAPDTLASVRTTPVNDRILFPVQSIAKAIFLNDHKVFNETGEKTMGLEELVRKEEPFVTLPPNIVQQLFDGEPSGSLPKDLVQQLHYSCPLVMSSYKNQDDATYQSAIWHLQKYSVFPEGSPLVYAESDMDEEEKEKLHVLINKPTCCRERKPRLSDLMRILTDEAYHWNEIGVHLDVPPGVRSGLYESNKSDETRLSEVLQYWLQHGTNHGIISAAWEILLDVLIGPLKNGRLYQEIRQFLGEDTSNSLSPVPASPDLPHVKSDNVSTADSSTAQTVGTSSPSLTEVSKPDAEQLSKVNNTHPVQQETDSAEQLQLMKESDQQSQMKQTDKQQSSTSREQKQLPAPQSISTPVVAKKGPVPDDMLAAAQPTNVSKSMTILEQNKELLKDSTADQIADLLDKIGLGKYKETFEEMEVDGQTFFELTVDTLKDPDMFSMASKFHQAIVMKYVNGEKLVPK